MLLVVRYTSVTLYICVVGDPPRYTYQVFIVNSSFTANNATNTQPEPLPGIYDTGECAGVHISSCSCVSILNNTFTDNTGIGVCVRDINGRCEDLGDPDSDYYPTFNRSAAVGSDNVYRIDEFLRKDIGIHISLDMRLNTFTGNIDPSLSKPAQLRLEDAMAGGAAIDIVNVPYTLLVGLIIENNIGRQGSGVHLDSCTATFIWNCSLRGNIATHEGGAIATVNSHSKGILIGMSILANNSALSGGAVYAAPGTSVLVTDGAQLANNSATTCGGAIECIQCQGLTLQANASMNFNNAKDGGGAAYCDGCTTVQVRNVELVNNR